MEGYQYTWARHSGKYDDVKGKLDRGLATIDFWIYFQNANSLMA